MKRKGKLFLKRNKRLHLKLLKVEVTYRVNISLHLITERGSGYWAKKTIPRGWVLVVVKKTKRPLIVCGAWMKHVTALASVSLSVI